MTETGRIKELVENFDLDAYFISGSKRADVQSQLFSFWFEGLKSGQIHLLPNIKKIYGLKLAWGFLLSIVVCVEILTSHLARSINLVITREPEASVLVLAMCKVVKVKTLYNADPPFPHKAVNELGGVAFQNPITRSMMKVLDYACLTLASFVAVPDQQAQKELRDGAGFVWDFNFSYSSSTTLHL